ncbi:hypothetical protein QWY85_11725 [Neolewinella lacunae]|uniref:Uncharacterized protein n=1 Tax=Neolewinella lacunae TaxID=1517758 RepID=A0A923PI96_9BACT|nr:hypothetical protein [Neolewinella lacunae]MBC6993779.1 hypothetical protein [Neolewinella lacunae]MDN3635330.1 hypothetical protein [Neolewinella lacunae]
MTATTHIAGMNALGTTGTRLASVTDASPIAGKAFGDVILRAEGLFIPNTAPEEYMYLKNLFGF